MIRNNKKGLTTIELLLSFILLMIIVVGMFRIVFNYKEKSRILTISNELNTYKTVLTKVFNDELAVKTNMYAKAILNCTYKDTPTSEEEAVNCIDIYSNVEAYHKRIIVASNKIVFGDINTSGVLINEKKYPFPNQETMVSSTSVNVKGIYTVITMILSNNTASDVKSKMVLYAKTTMSGPIAEIVLNKIEGGDASLETSDPEETFIKGENPNNYLWYSGKMWRVVSILSDGSVKLVTDNNMADILYGPNNTFSNSYAKSWVTDVFYPTLKSPSTYVQAYNWNATARTTANMMNKAVSGDSGYTVVSSNVGLLNMYEYHQTIDSGLSYLNISKYWRTLTPSSNETYDGTSYQATYNINVLNAIEGKRMVLPTGIRPAVIIKSNIQIVTGDGTIDNPYKFAIDNEKESDIVNDNLNTRSNGEYVNFANTLWRIIGIESNTTKLMMVNPLNVTMNFSNSASSTQYSTSVTCGSYLNSTWYGSLLAKNKYMLTTGTWNRGSLASTASYVNAMGNTINLLVGMSKVGEMFSSSYGEAGESIFTLTSGNGNAVWYIHADGYTKYVAPNGASYYLRPSVFLKSDVFITSGTGLYDNPFNVDIGYEEVYDTTPNPPLLADGMIPIKYDATNNRWVKANSANTNYDWYNYAGKKWANAVMVTSTSRTAYKNASVGSTVSESDILAYFVWIPRFKYRIFNPTFVSTSPQLIDMQFESGTATTGTSTSLFNLYTHPAFTFGNTQLTGFWVAKFEASAPVGTTCQTTPSAANCDFSESYATIKPNQRAVNYQVTLTAQRMPQNFLSSIYLNSSNNVDAHLMKNLEWGAVTYLTMSRYGKGENTYTNNSSSYYTGRSGGGSTTATANGTYSYDGFTCTTAACDSGARDTNTKALAYGASTTGNIYGIYDMGGGIWELVAGNYNNTVASGGTFSHPKYLPTKYFDIYTGTTKASSKMGDAMGETSYWYSTNEAFVDSANPWFYRGGDSASAITTSGPFAYSRSTGAAVSYLGHRPTIIVTATTAGYTTTGYVTSGLILHFDGINNTGIGHSNDIGVWKNITPGVLITSMQDPVGVFLREFELSTNVTTSNSGWHNDSLRFDGTNDFLKFSTLYKYAQPTVEVVVSYPANDKITILGNPETGGLGFDRGPNSFLAYINGGYKAATSSQATVINKVYSLSGSYNLSQVSLYENGVKYTNSQTKAITYNSTTVLALGCNPSGTSCGTFVGMRVYSFRLYNRALSDAERLQNYAVDAARFGIS